MEFLDIAGADHTAVHVLFDWLEHIEDPVLDLRDVLLVGEMFGGPPY